MVKDLDPKLYELICETHELARKTHTYSYEVPTPVLVRMALGRVQSILIHYVVKYASSTDKQQNELD